MKGIDFTPDMHRAIREGRKCMTRRVVKCPKGHPYPSEWQDHGSLVKCSDGWVWSYGHDENDNPIDYPLTSKYKVGDRVFVREAWSKVPATAYRHSREEDSSMVPHRVSPCGDWWAVYKDGWDRSAPTWKSGRFMPEWASRTILEITGVRVERVNEITNDDAIAEGVEHPFTQKDFDVVTPSLYAHFPNGPESTGWRNYLWHGLYGNYGMGSKKSDQWEYQFSSYSDPIGSFSSLWESIHGQGAWIRNDWVFVYEFKVVQNA